MTPPDHPALATPRYRILAIEDDATVRALIVAILTGNGYDVQTCESLQQARTALARDSPDLITLDLQLPDGSGLDLLRDMRLDQETSGLPVLVVTGTYDASFIATALEAGAQDFIRKPFEPVELVARVAAALRVKRMYDSVTRLATYDALTAVPNRRGLLAALSAQLAHRDRSNEPLAVAMFDVVDFKGINDTFGHTAGDRVLREVAEVMARGVRAGDVLGRIGGDEFLAVLPGTDAADARRVVDRLKEDVRDEVVVPNRLVELRAGLATAPARGTGTDELLHAVSDRLRRGR